MTAGTPPSWRATRAEVAETLRAAGIAAPDVEARWITETASGTDASEWFDLEQERPSDRAAAHVAAMTARRVRGEPLQYALGSWSFRGLDLMVDRARPDPAPRDRVGGGDRAPRSGTHRSAPHHRPPQPTRVVPDFAD